MYNNRARHSGQRPSVTAGNALCVSRCTQEGEVGVSRLSGSGKCAVVEARTAGGGEGGATHPPVRTLLSATRLSNEPALRSVLRLWRLQVKCDDEAFSPWAATSPASASLVPSVSRREITDWFPLLQSSEWRTAIVFRHQRRQRQRCSDFPPPYTTKGNSRYLSCYRAGPRCFFPLRRSCLQRADQAITAN